MKQYLIILVACMLSLHSVAQQYGSFKDSRDGRVYKTVKIGTQVWMAENLNVESFRNGDSITQIQNKEEWVRASWTGKPAWAYVEYYDLKNKIKYTSKVYNWYAVNDSRGLAPLGYHIPIDEEWTTLITYLGGEDVAGKKMKSTSGWETRETGGSKTCTNCADWSEEYRRKVPCHICKDTRKIAVPKKTYSGNGSNQSGFSAIPYGSHPQEGYLYSLGGRSSVWWSKTEKPNPEYVDQSRPAQTAFVRLIYNTDESVTRYDLSKGLGLSVRCLKD